MALVTPQRKGAHLAHVLNAMQTTTTTYNVNGIVTEGAIFWDDGRYHKVLSISRYLAIATAMGFDADSMPALRPYVQELIALGLLDMRQLSKTPKI